jgi:hypothetical protein
VSRWEVQIQVGPNPWSVVRWLWRERIALWVLLTGLGIAAMVLACAQSSGLLVGLLMGSGLVCFGVGAGGATWKACNAAYPEQGSA